MESFVVNPDPAAYGAIFSSRYGHSEALTQQQTHFLLSRVVFVLSPRGTSKQCRQCNHTGARAASGPLTWAGLPDIKRAPNGHVTKMLQNSTESLNPNKSFFDPQ